MKSETIIYGLELLTILDKNENISFSNLEKISKIKGSELKELLRYLKQKGYLIWKSSPFIGTLDNINLISDDKIKLAPKGMEVVLEQREYFDDSNKISQEIHNQTNIHGDKNLVAQNTGNNSSIIQIQNNTKLNVLKQLIGDDKELNEGKKKKLLNILEKFNTLKESGENAYGLIKQVSSIAIKYVPLFFGLLN